MKAWWAAHPRFHLHFTPTAISWLNLVGRWFRELTDQALRRGVLHSMPDLIASIEKDMGVLNVNPSPRLDRQRRIHPDPRCGAETPHWTKQSVNDETVRCLALNAQVVLSAKGG